MENKKKFNFKLLLEYLAIALIVLAVITLYLSIAKEAKDLLSLSKTKDYVAVKEMLQQFGTKGIFIISTLEMLQMIVVFIPAEFIQIASGLAYPIYIGLPVCIFGIFCGASVIFTIVRVFKIKLSVIGRKNKKIESIVNKINKDTSMIVIMYLLFVMPLIPFGAIAYFASSSKISYKKYILCCTTGVIPSILSSFVLGNVMYNCIGLGTETLALASITVAVFFIVLLLLIASIIRRIFLVKSLEKPSFLVYHVMYLALKLFFFFKGVRFSKDCVKVKEKCFLIVGTHSFFYDFYAAAKTVYPKRLSIVCNRFYFDYKKTKFWVKALGAIPKSLFSSDVETIKSLLQARNRNFPILIFPEGRLSTSGNTFPIARGTENLIKKLGLDTYFYSTLGAYYAKPKWRNYITPAYIQISLKKLFTAQQTQDLDFVKSRLAEEFDKDYTSLYIKKGKKLKPADVTGLDGVIFKCPNCQSEFTTRSKKDKLYCEACGKEYLFNSQYKSDGRTIDYFYQNQLKSIKKSNQLTIKNNCTVSKLNIKLGRMESCGQGVCEIADGKITFNGTIDNRQTNFTHTTLSLQAIAYSVNEEFEFYYDGVLYFFYPENQKEVIKWSIIWDILQIEQAKISTD